MATADFAPEVTIWTDGVRAAILAELFDVMGNAVCLIGVGGPRDPAVDRLSHTLNLPREDDLRKMIAQRPAAYLLLAADGPVEPADLLAAAGQDTTILAIEPVAADLQQLAALRSTGRSRAAVSKLRIIHMPAFTQSPGFLSAAEPFDMLGIRRLLSFDSYGNHQNGSLFARLVDAWRTALAFTELPVSIDASLIGEIEPAPDDLRRIRGRLAAHARTSDGSAILLNLSDRAGIAGRSLHVLGDEGQLRVSDIGYDLRHLDVDEIDHHQPRSEPLKYVDLIANQWRRLIDRPGAATADDHPHREAEILACCLACLLSARTAQPESPRKLLEISR